MTTRRRRWDVLLSAALFLLLALLFVPECDDCYFIYWDFASWKDFLLVRPIPQEGVVLGVPSNGRYLGNLLGLILGKLAFSPLWPLRVLILMKITTPSNNLFFINLHSCSFRCLKTI